MPKSRKKKRSPKRVLVLPDLEQSKAAVLNSLTSKSGQRTYDHAISDFVDLYCSEPRLAFNRTVVPRYRILLEQAVRTARDQPTLGRRPSSGARGRRFRPAQSNLRSPVDIGVLWGTRAGDIPRICHD